MFHQMKTHTYTPDNISKSLAQPNISVIYNTALISQSQKNSGEIQSHKNQPPGLLKGHVQIHTNTSVFKLTVYPKITDESFIHCHVFVNVYRRYLEKCGFVVIQ